MRLSDTLTLTGDARRTDAAQAQIIDDQQLAVRVFNEIAAGSVTTSSRQWISSWLESQRFILMRIPLNLLAAPRAAGNRMYAAAITNDPIVVDLNKRRIGAGVNSPAPTVIVVHGVERFMAASNRGDSRIQAWVGTKAAKKLGLINADHELSSQELYDAIQLALAERYPPNNTSRTAVLSTPNSYVAIEQVYPFEDYCIYNYEGKKYRQRYQVNTDRSVTLDGPPTQTQLQYVDNPLAASAHAAEDIYGCGCGQEVTATRDMEKLNQVQRNNLPFVMGSTGKQVSVGKLLPAYRKAVAGGWRNRVELEGKAAPGWEGTVKQMKKHKDVDNPWALSHWAKQQGYTPHYTKSGKPKD